MPSNKIAVLGSVNMDLVVFTEHLPRPGETLTGHEVFEAPGGKGGNQAVGAARLGGSVDMIGRVGDDPFGDRLLESLDGSGVRTAAVRRTEGCPSGAAVVIVDDHGENSIIVTPGANGRLSATDILAASEVIQAASVLLLQLEVPMETVLAGIDVAREAGVRVVLDPAPAPRTLPPELLSVDLITPNQTEAEALLGHPVPSIEAAQSAAPLLTTLGAGEALITLGALGAVWSNGDQTELLRTPTVHAVDTTAAGDAFSGALAVALADGAETLEAARYACAAGASAATRKGAQQAMPTAEDIAELLKPIGRDQPDARAPVSYTKP